MIQPSCQYIKLKKLIKHPVYDEVKKFLVQSTVLIFFSTEGEGDDGGSGTLVTYKGIKGILTASHVAANIRNEELLLPCVLREGKKDELRLDKIPLKRKITIDDYGAYSLKGDLEKDNFWRDETLDISLLQIEDEIFEELLKNGQKKPVDLTVLRNKYDNFTSNYWSPSNSQNWSWAIVGVPREGILHNQQDNIREFSSAGVYHGGGECKFRETILSKVIDQYQGEQADVIETFISPFAERLPKDFAGMSGGGIWQIRVKIVSNGHYLIENIMLAGVFVAVEKIDATGDKYLISRGHISLYEIFCVYLDRVLDEMQNFK